MWLDISTPLILMDKGPNLGSVVGPIPLVGELGI